jgi:hypothetical protein
MSDFRIDFRELMKYSKFIRNSPQNMRTFTAGYLTTMALYGMRYAKNQITSNMTIRSPQFVKASIRYEKAQKGAEIHNQRSIMGSIILPRSTAWAEQEGEFPRKPRKKKITLAAREGNFKNKVPRKYRMNRAKAYWTPQKLKIDNARSEHHRAVIMLQMFGRKSGKLADRNIKTTGVFLLEWHNRLPKGIYEFRYKKLKLLQNLAPMSVAARRIPWMRNTIKETNTPSNRRRIWKNEINRWIARYKGRM